MANDVKWIKITTDIFDDEKISLIEALPEADSVIVIWFKLLVLAGKQNNMGVFMMSNRIPYTDEMLAAIFRRNVNVVRVALKTFERFGMIEIIDNVITIPNWNKHQTLDSYEKKKERDRLYQRERREFQKALISGSSEESSDESSDKSSDNRLTTDDSSSGVGFSEIEIEKEDKKENKREKIDYQLIADMYHKLCPSFPKIRFLSDSRKKAIKARMNTYTLDDFHDLFEAAEASSFLKGQNEHNWSADFDWLIKDKNMGRVLEGNYADRPKAKIPQSPNKAKAYSNPALDYYNQLMAEQQQGGEKVDFA